MIILISHIYLQLNQEKTFELIVEEEISFILSIFSKQYSISNSEENQPVFVAQAHLDSLSGSDFGVSLDFMNLKHLFGFVAFNVTVMIPLNCMIMINTCFQSCTEDGGHHHLEPFLGVF